jgi:hypothetical protein
MPPSGGSERAPAVVSRLRVHRSCGSMFVSSPSVLNERLSARSLLALQRGIKRPPSRDGFNLHPAGCQESRRPVIKADSLTYPRTSRQKDYQMRPLRTRPAQRAGSGFNVRQAGVVEDIKRPFISMSAQNLLCSLASRFAVDSARPPRTPSRATPFAESHVTKLVMFDRETRGGAE